MRGLARNLIGAAALLVVACSPTAPAPAPSGPASGAAPAPAATAEPSRSAKQTIQYSSSLFPASASPESTGQGSGHWWYQFDSLLMFDNKLTLLPSVATKWELLPD